MLKTGSLWITCRCNVFYHVVFFELENVLLFLMIDALLAAPFTCPCWFGGAFWCDDATHCQLSSPCRTCSLITVFLFYFSLQIIGLLNVFTPQKTLEEFQDVWVSVSQMTSAHCVFVKSIQDGAHWGVGLSDVTFRGLWVVWYPKLLLQIQSTGRCIFAWNCLTCIHSWWTCLLFKELRKTCGLTESNYEGKTQNLQHTKKQLGGHSLLIRSPLSHVRQPPGSVLKSTRRLCQWKLAADSQIVED